MNIQDWAKQTANHLIMAMGGWSQLTATSVAWAIIGHINNGVAKVWAVEDCTDELLAIIDKDAAEDQCISPVEVNKLVFKALER